MLSFFIRPAFRAGFAALLLLSLAACGKQRVLLVEPKESDLIQLNGCVVSACNYLAVTKAQHRLEPDFWAKILLVRFENHPAGHAYCVWETEGTVYGYDRNSGGFPLPIYTHDPQAIAIVLAQQLGKVMGETLSVKSAGFVEPSTTEIYAYGMSRAPAVPATAPVLGSSALFHAPPLSLQLSEQRPLGH
ncbi:MAG: hypothetical protein M3Y80_03580 [Verrucomicrobiota bacterium]|nr:hypothetical protein [Verrucomicrobiota bacterium]